MNWKNIPVIIVCIICLVTSCRDQAECHDYDAMMTNHLFTLMTPDGRKINNYLSKPAGDRMDLVVVLHGGTKDYETSISATLKQSTDKDGGAQFLEEGHAIIAVQYTEFQGSKDDIGVTKGIFEMIDILTLIDYILDGTFSEDFFEIDGLFVFGHSRGGANALLTGIERPLDGVISAEGPINWIAINDSIRTGFLNPSEWEKQRYESTTVEWGDPLEDPTLWKRFSPALRIAEFQSPFMVIQGENDIAAFVDLAIQMRRANQSCNSCPYDGSYIIHPNGHTDWALPGVLDTIREFIIQH